MALMFGGYSSKLYFKDLSKSALLSMIELIRNIRWIKNNKNRMTPIEQIEKLSMIITATIDLKDREIEALEEMITDSVLALEQEEGLNTNERKDI